MHRCGGLYEEDVYMEWDVSFFESRKMSPSIFIFFFLILYVVCAGVINFNIRASPTALAIIVG